MDIGFRGSMSNYQRDVLSVWKGPMVIGSAAEAESIV